MVAQVRRRRGYGYGAYHRHGSHLGRFRPRGLDGYEQAKRHIEEANEFREEVGGTDEDVKEYFFTLPETRKEQVLRMYGDRFGESAEEYARETLEQWRTGRVKMSGMVAKRLFGLLPPLMTLPEKYRLTEKLWVHIGPSSQKLLLVGADAPVETVTRTVEEYLSSTVSSYKIPKEMERRFEWLSVGDVAVKQNLLNHLLNQERSLVVEGTRRQLPVLLEAMRNDSEGHIGKLATKLEIGKHILEIRVERDHHGVRLADWTPYIGEGTPAFTVEKSYGWVWWAVGGIILILILAGS